MMHLLEDVATRLRACALIGINPTTGTNHQRTDHGHFAASTHSLLVDKLATPSLPGFAVVATTFPSLAALRALPTQVTLSSP